jgi:hypothetical protein
MCNMLLSGPVRHLIVGYLVLVLMSTMLLPCSHCREGVQPEGGDADAE